jgi:hypothetical protein
MDCWPVFRHAGHGQIEDKAMQDIDIHSKASVV